MKFAHSSTRPPAPATRLWGGNHISTAATRSVSPPTVTISSKGGVTTAPYQTITGTVDLADAGSKVTIFDASVAIGSATVGSNGTWSANVKLTQTVANVLKATDANSGGTGTSNTVAYNLVTATAPTLTIAHSSLTVAAGGIVALGIHETAPSYASSATVKITGLPSYETILEGKGDTFKGSSITLTEAQVNSGLTLASHYTGAGHPTATLMINASDTIAGVTKTTAARTIVVVDPAATSATSEGLTTATDHAVLGNLLSNMIAENRNAHLAPGYGTSDFLAAVAPGGMDFNGVRLASPHLLTLTRP